MTSYRVYYSYGGTQNWTDNISADSYEITNNMVIFKKGNNVVKMYSLRFFVYAEAT